MKKRIRSSYEMLVGKIPLSANQLLIRRDVVGIFYHMVSDEVVPHTEHLYPHRDIEVFEQDLQFIRENYQVLSFDDLLAKRYSQGGIRKPAIFLSFDDGFSQCYSLVRPLLLKHEIPCMFFITTNFIDNQQMYYRNKVSLCIDRFKSLETVERRQVLRAISEEYDMQVLDGELFIRWIKTITVDDIIDKLCSIFEIDIKQYLSDHKPYMSVGEIKSMAADGFTIGAHSQRHQKLSRLSKDEIQNEIVWSCELINQITCAAYVPFSFPNTATGIDRNFLNQILLEHPSIGMLFDAKGLDLDCEFIYNRIWVESPKFNAGGNKSLQHVMETAYRDYLMQRLNKLRSG